MQRPALLAFLALTVAACSDSSTDNTSSANELPTLLEDCLEAHGGMDRWRVLRTLQYTMTQGERTEIHKTDLQNRKVLISHDDYQIGFDGEQVWVAPDKAAYGGRSARFYHNLNFYFFAIPFVVADPGINYEVLEPDSLNGKSYNRLKVSYDEGVGDAPDDYYLLHMDPETNRLEILLYTVTYYQGETSDRYNAIDYREWQEVGGLLLPKLMVGYRYEDDRFGNERYRKIFAEVILSEEPPDQNIFTKPDRAEIDSLPERDAS